MPDTATRDRDLDPNTLGNLTGAYPSCTITPEPAAIGLLGLGALALLKRKRKS